jgi:hypothetical protein
VSTYNYINRGQITKTALPPFGPSTIAAILHSLRTHRQEQEAKNQPKVKLSTLYNRKTAYAVIEQSMRDYENMFQGAKKGITGGCLDNPRRA